MLKTVVLPLWARDAKPRDFESEPQEKKLTLFGESVKSKTG